MSLLKDNIRSYLTKIYAFYFDKEKISQDEHSGDPLEQLGTYNK